MRTAEFALGALFAMTCGIIGYNAGWRSSGSSKEVVTAENKTLTPARHMLACFTQIDGNGHLVIENLDFPTGLVLENAGDAIVSGIYASHGDDSANSVAISCTIRWGYFTSPWSAKAAMDHITPQPLIGIAQ